VLIEGSNGITVSLRPVRWQFPPGTGAWDDQWVIISGTVDLGDRSWSFTDPCLLIGEARELATWLHKAARGEVEPRNAADHDGEPSLSFVEPKLGFSITSCGDDELDLLIIFATRAAPPWLRDDPKCDQYAVEVRLQPSQLLSAADAWTQELNALPSRTFASIRT
jgi:hypothetical protein